MKKAWPYITVFLTGIIAGIIVFAKYLDGPDYRYEITIKKLKSKRNQGENSGILPVIQVDTEKDIPEKKKRKFSLKTMFKLKK